MTRAVSESGAIEPVAVRRALGSIAESSDTTQLPDSASCVHVGEPARQPLPVHRIVPQHGTAYTETCLPAELTDPDAYPVEAFCAVCGKPARKASISGQWRHLDRAISRAPDRLQDGTR